LSRGGKGTGAAVFFSDGAFAGGAVSGEVNKIAGLLDGLSGAEKWAVVRGDMVTQVSAEAGGRQFSSWQLLLLLGSDLEL
jgi:hypothetical protein